MVVASLKMIDDALLAQNCFSIWKEKCMEEKEEKKNAQVLSWYIKEKNFTALPQNKEEKFSAWSHKQRRWIQSCNNFHPELLLQQITKKIINLVKILKNFFTTLTYAKRNDFLAISTGKRRSGFFFQLKFYFTIHLKMILALLQRY